MSQANDVFQSAIKDAENLLQHFNSLNSQPPPPETEVMKRAGLIMAMTAWETYVEDRVLEHAKGRLEKLNDRAIALLVESKLNEEIKRLHNPTSEKTIQLFLDYAGVDLSHHWKWNHFDIKAVKDSLNRYMRLRGEVVHRSVTLKPGQPQAVTKDELEKLIRFLKNLVGATEKALVHAA